MPEISSVSASASALPKKKRSLLLSIVVITLVFLGLAGGTVALAYDVFVSHGDGSLVRTASNALPIPAARVGSRTILYRTFLRDRDVVKKFLASPAAAAQQMNVPYDANVEQSIVDKLMVEAIIDELAQQKNITVAEAEVLASFSEVVTAASSTTPDMGAYLRDNFGWTEEDFRQQVLRPAMLQDKVGLAMMNEANGDAEALATAIQRRLADSDVVKYLRF